MKPTIVYVDALFDESVSRLTQSTLNNSLELYHRQRSSLYNLKTIRVAHKNPSGFADQVLENHPALVILSGCEKNISDYSVDTWVQAYVRSLRTLVDNMRHRHEINKSIFSLFGICFGHQAIAYLHGARVKKVGLSVGLVQCHAPHFEHPTPLISFHGDQVVDIPQGFERYLYSRNCKIQGLVHKKYPIMTIQSHPEFTSDIMMRKNRHQAWSTCKKLELDKHQGATFLENVYSWAKL